MFFKKEEKQVEEQGEQYEQSQPQSSGGGYYQPMIMASEKADLYDKIRPEDTIKMLQYKFRGFDFDENKQQWIENPALRDVSLSEVGASQMAILLLPVANKGTSITKTEDADIRKRTKQLVHTAMKDCLYHWEAYGIKSPSTFFFVKEVIISIAFLTLKQSEDGGGRRFIQGASQEIKNISEQVEKRGGLSGIFRR